MLLSMFLTRLDNMKKLNVLNMFVLKSVSGFRISIFSPQKKTNFNDTYLVESFHSKQHINNLCDVVPFLPVVCWYLCSISDGVVQCCRHAGMPGGSLAMILSHTAPGGLLSLPVTFSLYFIIDGIFVCIFRCFYCI